MPSLTAAQADPEAFQQRSHFLKALVLQKRQGGKRLPRLDLNFVFKKSPSGHLSEPLRSWRRQGPRLPPSATTTGQRSGRVGSREGEKLLGLLSNYTTRESQFFSPEAVAPISACCWPRSASDLHPRLPVEAIAGTNVGLDFRCQGQLVIPYFYVSLKTRRCGLPRPREMLSGSDRGRAGLERDRPACNPWHDLRARSWLGNQESRAASDLNRAGGHFLQQVPPVTGPWLEMSAGKGEAKDG